MTDCTIPGDGSVTVATTMAGAISDGTHSAPRTARMSSLIAGERGSGPNESPALDSWPRRRVVWALAVRHWRIALRSSRFLAGMALAAAIALTQGTPATPAQAVALAFFLAAIVSLVIGAGSIARDFGSGMMVLDRLHGARPSEIVLGAVAHVTAIGFAVLLVAATARVVQDPALLSSWLAGALAVAALLLLGWCALLVMLGAAVPGEGNAAAAIGLVILASLAPRVEQGASPELVKGGFRLLRMLLPTPHQFVSLARTLDNGMFPYRATAVLCLVALSIFAGTLLILRSRDPASGWRR